MTEALPLHGELFVGKDGTDDDQRLVTEALAALGVRVIIKPGSAHNLRGPDAVTWVVLALLPLQAVIGGLGTKAGEDAWAQLRQAVVSIAARRRGTPPEPLPGAPSGPLVLQDTASGIKILLESDLPDSAYAALLELDLSRFRLGPLHYDRGAERWRSIADEAAEYGL